MCVHGTRAQYQGGCRCLPCRSANSAYRAQTRRREPVACLVPAAPATTHLITLKGLGVGKRRAAALAGVSVKTIADIRAGYQSLIHPDTAQRILAIKPSLAKGQRVSAYPAWRAIRALEHEGFTRAEIAARLRLQTPSLQFDHGEGARMTVRNVLKVQALYRQTMQE